MAEARGATGSALQRLTCMGLALGIPPELLNVRRLARAQSVEETGALLAAGARDGERRDLRGLLS